MASLLGLILLVLIVILLVQVSSMKSAMQAFQTEMEKQVRQLRREFEWFLKKAGADAPHSTGPVPSELPPPIPQVAPPPVPQHPVRSETGLPAPAKPTGPPSPPSRADEILRKIWEWVLVGEEYRTKGMTMEFSIATTWLMRAGIIALVACAAYFLKWSIEQELIGPAARVGIGIFAGIAMLVAGVRLTGGRWDILGHGFMGGGIAILFFSMYAAGPMYHLFQTPLVFGLMILITVTAGILAIYKSSLLVAIFGIMGGYCTPILLKTDHPNLPVFYGYLLLLSIGILGISRARQWRLLNYLGFVFTYALFIFTWLTIYTPGDFPVSITFLTLFFVTHSFIVYSRDTGGRTPATSLEIIHLLLNSAVFSTVAYFMIRSAALRPWPAVMTLALAVFYFAQVAFLFYRRLTDRPLLTVLIALAGLYTVLTMPLVVEKESLTICWALTALMLLWIGASLKDGLMRHIGHVVYLIVAVRILVLDFPDQYDIAHPASGPMGDYWNGMVPRLWTFGMSIGSMLAAYFVERAYGRCSEVSAAGEPDDAGAILSFRTTGTIFSWIVPLLMFVYLQLEFYSLMSRFGNWQFPVMTLLWCAMAGYFLVRHLATGSGTASFAAMCVFLFAAVIKSITWDMQAWLTGGHGSYIYGPDYGIYSVAQRWLGFGGILGILFCMWRLFRARNCERTASYFFGYGALSLFFFYLSMETNSFLHFELFEFQAGGISVLWGLFAAVFLVAGIWKDAVPLRYAGLVLFAVVACKIPLVDLSDMPVIYRVVAFMVVGVFLLLGSFAYLYANRKFERKQ